MKNISNGNIQTLNHLDSLDSLEIQVRSLNPLVRVSNDQASYNLHSNWNVSNNENINIFRNKENEKNYPIGKKKVKKQFMLHILKWMKLGKFDEILSFTSLNSLNISEIIDEDYHQTPIFVASLIGDSSMAFETIKCLINEGVPANHLDVMNQTALFYIARQGKINCVDILIQNGCSVNHKDIFGQTPIYYSVKENRIEMTNKLVQLGANVNNDDNNGQTPIFFASIENREDMCRLLVSLGANVNAQDKQKQTPLQIAKKTHNFKMYELLTSLGAFLPLENPLKDKKLSIKKQNDYLDKGILRKYVLTKIRNGSFEMLEGPELKDLLNKNPEILLYLKHPENVEKIEIKIPPPNTQIFEYWEKAAKKIMNILWKINGASLFHAPVDPVSLNIPDYFEVIKKPMDFGTIKQRLNNSFYNNVNEFIFDVELVFKNCIEYNGELSYYGILSKQMKEEFRKLQETFALSYYM